MALSLAELKAASKLKTIDVDVPEFGGTITLRQLDGRRGLAVATKAPQSDTPQSDTSSDAVATFYIDLIASSVIDASGELILDTKEGRELVGNWPFNILSDVGATAAELNGMAGKKKD